LGSIISIAAASVSATGAGAGAGTGFGRAKAILARAVAMRMERRILVLTCESTSENVLENRIVIAQRDTCCTNILFNFLSKFRV
jgi:hypothetical protein